MAATIETPILDSPFEAPTSHFAFDEERYLALRAVGCAAAIVDVRGIADGQSR